MSDTFDLGGGGNTSFSFGPQGAQPGASVTGTVLDMAEVQQRNFDTGIPETWDNGDPKMQVRLTLQTELRDPAVPTDDGKRDVYLRGRKKPHDNGAKSTICAVLDAVRAATGGTQLQRGGRLTLQWVSGMGFSGDPRNYQATYQPPALDLASQQQAQPLQQQAVQQQPAPVSTPAPQFVQTPQGIVNVTTGQLVQAAPAQAAPAQVATAPVPETVPATAGPSAEQIAAVRAAGLDPAQVLPGYVGG